MHVHSCLVSQEKMKGNKVNSYMDLIPKVIPVELFLDMVPSSSMDAVTTRVAWMFTCMMKINK